MPIFGAALGNFLNLVKQHDPETKQPVVNIRAAIVACPGMMIGSMAGLLINKMLPAFFLITILEYFLYITVQKFYKNALKEWNAENQRKLNVNSIEIPLIGDEKPAEVKSHSLAENLDIIVFVLMIVGTMLLGFFIRGSPNFNSIIGI